MDLALIQELYRYNRWANDRVFEAVAALSPQDFTKGLSLHALRNAMVELGAPRRLRAGRAAAEQRQLDRLGALARRVGAGRVIPGMTIHQAKGREWDHVGVRLSETEVRTLAGGLRQEIEGNRALYTALTRARVGVTTVE